MYLPALWEPEQCYKTPLTLAFTPGHFTALVPRERGGVGNAGVAQEAEEQAEAEGMVALVDGEGRALPVQFVLDSEAGEEAGRQLCAKYMHCVVASDGALMAVREVG